LNRHQLAGKQNKASDIKGPIFAIVTPFNSSGDVDFAALADYLRFLDRAGAPTLVVNGTTGEFPSMTLDERQAVLEFCHGHFPGSLIANVTGCCFKDCQSLLEHACAEVADAAMLLPPFFYAEATFEGLIDFYQAAIAKSTIPLFLYNFPKHTRIEVTPELFAAICETNDQVRGIKDSGGNPDNALAYKSARPDIQVFVGNDSLAFATLENGLDGSVTGAGNPVPECLVGLTRAYATGRRDDALNWQRVTDGWRSYRKDLGIPEIAVAKAGLAARIPGFPTYLRPPLSSPDRETVERIAEHMARKVLPAIAGVSAGV